MIAFPVNLFIKLRPEPVHGVVVAPPPSETVAYGEYLASMSCVGCHSPHDEQGNRLAGREFSGGFMMAGPWGRNVSSNLTPHPNTFVGRASKEVFITRFKAFATMTATTAPKAEPGRNTLMPWIPMSRMKTSDLGAIYEFLKTLDPIANEVEPFPDAPKG